MDALGVDRNYNFVPVMSFDKIVRFHPFACLLAFLKLEVTSKVIYFPMN